MNKKQREKLLDGLMGIAYSYAAFSGGLSVYQHNLEGYINMLFTIIIMVFISNLYED